MTPRIDDRDASPGTVEAIAPVAFERFFDAPFDEGRSLGAAVVVDPPIGVDAIHRWKRIAVALRLATGAYRPTVASTTAR